MKVRYRSRLLTRLLSGALAAVGFSGSGYAAEPASVEHSADSAHIEEATSAGPIIWRVDKIRARLMEKDAKAGVSAPQQYAQWRNWRN
jgi:hypothetical protein